jgi:hypothetical protein
MKKRADQCKKVHSYFIYCNKSPLFCQGISAKKGHLPLQQNKIKKVKNRA